MSKGGPIPTLGLACPSGGDFYICQGNSTQFIGCCTTDPCADGSGSCPQANLEPATFNKLDYQGIAAQSCTDTKAEWYLCSALSTPFMGCCSSNACTNTAGCPQSDLVAAELGNATQAEVFLTTTASAASTTKTMASSTSLSSATTSAAAAVTTTTTTTTTTAATAAEGTSNPDSSETGLSTGAKAGIGIGAVALIGLIGLLFLVIRRIVVKRRGVVVRGSEPPSPSTMSGISTSGYTTRNHLTYSTLHPTGAHEAQWPSPVSITPVSAGSSPSNISRETSLRSASSHTNNALGIMTGGTTAQWQRPQYHHQRYGSQYGHASPPLDTLVELDGGGAFSSPVVSEMAVPTPTTSRGSMPFRPYRPSR